MFRVTGPLCGEFTGHKILQFIIDTLMSVQKELHPVRKILIKTW